MTFPGTRASELDSLAVFFGAIPDHLKPGRANRPSIFIKSDVIPTDGAITIKIDEWRNAVIQTVLVKRHGVMCTIQKEIADPGLREEGFHPEKGMKETQGIMH